MKNLMLLIGSAMRALTVNLFSAEPAMAQTSCGNGTTYDPAFSPTSGQPMCIPITDRSSAQPSVPQGRWEMRWGAYADDEATGKVSMAGALSSNGKASKAAIAHCQSKGGTSCKLVIAHENRCAVAVAGEYSDGTWNRIFQSAAVLEEATDIAVDACSKNGAKDCKVYSSDCRYAEFVR